jgi:hypothetical protein
MFVAALVTFLVVPPYPVALQKMLYSGTDAYARHSINITKDIKKKTIEFLLFPLKKENI